MSQARELADVASNNTTESILAGRKNLLINGGFDVWQRGTSFTSNGYTADRWAVTGSGTFSFTKHGEPNKVLVSMVSEGSFCNLLQAIETSDVVKLRGKEVTLSAYMTTNSTHSGQFNIGARYSNTTDALTLQATSVISEAKTVGLATTRVSVTFTVPADAVGLQLFIDNSVVQAAGSLYDVSNVQLELGSQATDFEYRSYGEELALCQRYYVRDIKMTGLYAGSFRVSADLPVPMRIAPTAVLYDNSATLYYERWGLQAFYGNGTEAIGGNYSTNSVIDVAMSSPILLALGDHVMVFNNFEFDSEL